MYLNGGEDGRALKGCGEYNAFRGADRRTLGGFPPHSPCRELQKRDAATHHLRSLIGRLRVTLCRV